MNLKEYKKYVNEVNNNIENLLKDNEEELKLELLGYRQAILNNKKMLGLKEQLEEEK